MKKKTIMLQVILVIVFAFFCSCGGTNKNDTSKEFLNHATIKREAYTKDSIELIQQLETYLIEKKDFFHNSAYSNSTQLIVDSIIYSPDFNKLAVFLIIKNAVHKQLIPSRTYYWYYDATCYLGIRQNDTINLNWIGPSFTNSYDKNELSSIIRDSYLTNFAAKDSKGLHSYKYNLNDVRFWDSSIWKEIEDKKIKKQEFEEEKRKHPEKIYEPQK
jgi:hypothetical protein